MAATATHFKLGLFTLLGIAAALVVVFALGWRGLKPDTVRYHTYLDETVQGLELGAPVKYRGVAIGNVEDIQIAQDMKHVDVTLAIPADEARRLGLAGRAKDVRAQLGTQGITGVKFVDIDFFDAKANPLPQLSFAPSENYIPARPSLMKGLEGNLESVGQRLPDLVEVAIAALQRVDLLLADLGRQEFPRRLASTVDNIDGAVSDLRRLLQHVDRARLPDKLAASIDHLDASIAKVGALLESIGGDGGLVASTQRATDSIGDLGRSTSGAAAELERTLQNVDAAASAIRELAETLQDDPDMLVKGRAKRRKP